MPCPHNEISIVQRSHRQSAVAAAAYQSGEKLFCEYDQEVKHYPEKRGIVHNEILLPANAPRSYADRNTLWNAAEAVEKQWNSQLARRWVLTIPREIPPDQYAALVRDFCNQQFVSKGMCVDFAIHDKGDGNPHAHVMLTMRAMDERGKWLPKSRKVYELDKNGERIKLPSGRWKSHKEDTVDWNDRKYGEIWRHEWEVIQNRYLEANNRPERVDEAIIDQETFDNVQRIRGNARRYPDGFGEAYPLTGLMYCADCGGKMYVHRTYNGKRVPQYTCGQYGKYPIGSLCPTQHRIKAEAVLTLIADMLRAIAEYSKNDRAEFIRTVQETQAAQQTADISKKRKRLAAAQKRAGELERLICKIYEDNALGKLPDARYEALDAQYAKEQDTLNAEITELEKAVTGYEQSRKSAEKFIALIDKYENFDTLTNTMLNEFVEKILVHERARKGSQDTTQEVEIYFNFVGRYIPPALQPVPLTPEEQEELRKKEERKDRLHQNYLRRKANGKQKEWEERYNAKRKVQRDAAKAAIRAEDMEKGIFIPVSQLPRQEPHKATLPASAAV